MKRLDKVWNVWNDLDQSYANFNNKMIAKTGKGIGKLDFLKKILKYTGTEDDITNFKAMFSNEIKTYSAEELQKYEDLLGIVNDYIDILGMCLPDKNGRRLFIVDEKMSISDIRLTIAEHLQKTANAVQQMDLFSNDSTESETEESYDAQSNVKIEVPPYNVNDYFIVKSKSNCTPKELFSHGRLSNYFEKTENGIEFKCAPSAGEDYVYIDSKPALFNYFYQFSCNPASITDFKKAVYVYLLKVFSQDKQQKIPLTFPYVFINTELLSETTACYKVGTLSFRKNRMKKLNLIGKSFSDLTSKQHTNTSEIYELSTTNAGIDYTVCLVGNLE